jgi:hypothetical protein
MVEIRTMVEALERGGELPPGMDERFSGYGVAGVPFRSGHILALRRWPASSLGRSYTSLWNRNPEGRWVFIHNAPPQLACPRYFGSAISQALVREISIVWEGPGDFLVTVPGGYEINWRVSLGETFSSRILNILGGLIPGFLWGRESFLRLMGNLGGFMGAGKMSLTGRLPNGQWFISNPRYIWIVTATHAVVRGEDLGEMGPLPEQARVGDLWMPQQGRFFIGQAILESFDPNRHLSIYSQEGSYVQN